MSENDQDTKPTNNGISTALAELAKKLTPSHAYAVAVLVVLAMIIYILSDATNPDHCENVNVENPHLETGGSGNFVVVANCAANTPQAPK